MQTLQIRNSTAEFLIFTKQNKERTIEVIVDEESVWLRQKLMAELFGTTRNNITMHLTNILENELNKNSVCKEFLHTARDGKNYKTKYYNLDAIIAVRFKVNSKRAIEFRLWAINILKQYSVKGYVLDKERLKNGTFLNENYFDELLQEIREIRISERNFYQKITDIYSTSLDYNSQSLITQEFFKTVQNKMHYAVHGNTAAEVIVKNAINKEKNKIFILKTIGYSNRNINKIINSILFFIINRSFIINIIIVLLSMIFLHDIIPFVTWNLSRKAIILFTNYIIFIVSLILVKKIYIKKI